MDEKESKKVIYGFCVIRTRFIGQYCVMAATYTDDGVKVHDLSGFGGSRSPGWFIFVRSVSGDALCSEAESKANRIAQEITGAMSNDGDLNFLL